MKATAWGLLAGSFIVDGELLQAANSYSALSEAFNETTDAFYAQMSLVDIHMQLGDFASAEAALLEATPITEDEHNDLLAIESIFAMESELKGYQTKTDFEARSRYRVFDEVKSEMPVTLKDNKEGHLTNYPDPFNPTTNIVYMLSESGNVTLIVYDLLGREVRVESSTGRESRIMSLMK